MKKIISVLSALCLILSIGSLSAFATDAIIVKTAAELNEMRNNLNGNYVLENDIDLSDVDNWIPIGTKESPFTGKFNGKHHTIKNLKITDIGENEYAGLFGYAKNAEISGINICGEIALESDKAYVGAVCSFAEETNIKECVNYANISLTTTFEGKTACAGGLIGYLKYSAIEMCSNEGNLTVIYNGESPENPDSYKTFAGGVAGIATAQISNCRNAGKIYVEDNNYSAVGGIIGLFSGAKHLGQPPYPNIGYMFLHNAINTGEVIASMRKGGNPIVGYENITDWSTYDENEPELYDGCYYLDTTGEEISDKNFIAVKKEDMNKKETFPEFDFNDTWRITLSAGSPLLWFEDSSENISINVKTGEKIKIELKGNTITSTKSEDEIVALIEGEEIKGVHAGKTEIRVLLSDKTEIRFSVMVKFSLFCLIKAFFESIFNSILWR